MDERDVTAQPRHDGLHEGRVQDGADVDYDVDDDVNADDDADVEDAAAARRNCGWGRLPHSKQCSEECR